MKTYLEYKDDKSQKFWEISTTNNNITTKYGKIGANGREETKSYDDEITARFEMYKQIKAKKRKGYASPNVITMEALLNHKKTRFEDLEDYDLPYFDNRSNVIFINGNLTIEHLDLDKIAKNVDGLIIMGNLIVDTSIINLEGDWGPFLIVKGNVLADYFIAGGSEVYFEGESYIHTAIIGHYNAGILDSPNTTTLITLSSDYDMEEVSGNITYKLDDMQDEKFLNIVFKNEPFIECSSNQEKENNCCYLNPDKFNVAFIKDEIKIVKKLLKALKS